MSSGIILNGRKAGLVGPNLWDFTFFGEFVDSFFLHSGVLYFSQACVFF